MSTLQLSLRSLKIKLYKTGGNDIKSVDTIGLQDRLSNYSHEC